MEKIVNATEAVRKFSEILNSVRYRGASYTIIRGGKPVASLSPVETSLGIKILGELRGLVKSIPPLGADADRFREDLKELLKHQPALPRENRWA